MRRGSCTSQFLTTCERPCNLDLDDRVLLPAYQWQRDAEPPPTACINGIVAVDKPGGWTSSDVVTLIKNSLGRLLMTRYPGCESDTSTYVHFGAVFVRACIFSLSLAHTSLSFLPPSPLPLPFALIHPITHSNLSYLFNPFSPAPDKKPFLQNTHLPIPTPT